MKCGKINRKLEIAWRNRKREIKLAYARLFHFKLAYPLWNPLNLLLYVDKFKKGTNLSIKISHLNNIADVLITHVIFLHNIYVFQF